MFLLNERDRATARCCLSLNLHSDKRNISAVLGNVKKQGKANPWGEGLRARGRIAFLLHLMAYSTSRD
jgi:hypothetical protein